MALSGFFVDPTDTTRLTFADDCSVKELRGEWLDVHTVLSASELDELDLGGLESVGEDKKGRQVFELDMRQSISKRLKAWLVGWSFVSDKGAQTKPTFGQIQKLQPTIRREVLVLLDAHVKRALGREEVAEYVDETEDGIPFDGVSSSGSGQPRSGAESSLTLVPGSSGDA